MTLSIHSGLGQICSFKSGSSTIMHIHCAIFAAGNTEDEPVAGALAISLLVSVETADITPPGVETGPLLVTPAVPGVGSPLCDLQQLADGGGIVTLMSSVA